MRLVLLHGLGADHRAFQRFERLLPAAWDVRRFDLLGHGAGPYPTAGFHLDDLAAHAAGQIADAWPDAGASPPVVAGHSYGAATAIALAANRPDMARRIILLDPIVHVDGGSVQADSTRRSGEGGTQRMLRARREGTVPATVASLFAHESPALRRWIVETWEQMSLGVVDDLDLDWTRFAERVTCPVAIIHGELDLGGGGDLAADWFDEPHVRCIRGAGHYLHATHAREVAAELVAATSSAA